MIHVKLLAPCLKHTKCSINSSVRGLAPLAPPSSLWCSHVVLHYPCRPKFYTMALLRILLSDLIAFMTKIVTANDHLLGTRHYLNSSYALTH